MRSYENAFDRDFGPSSVVWLPLQLSKWFEVAGGTRPGSDDRSTEKKQYPQFQGPVPSVEEDEEEEYCLPGSSSSPLFRNNQIPFEALYFQMCFFLSIHPIFMVPRHCLLHQIDGPKKICLSGWLVGWLLGWLVGSCLPCLVFPLSVRLSSASDATL